MAQGIVENPVLPVDVGEEMNPSIPDGSGGIGNDHRKRFLQTQCGGAALGHRLNDALLGPFRFLGEDEFCQFDRFLDANAAMAEIAAVFLEQLRRRRVVQVNVVRVGKYELDVAERITRPRPLPDARSAGSDRVLELHAQGVARKAIAHDLGLSVATVGQWIADADRERITRIRAMAHAGVPHAAIAEMFGVSCAYVGLLSREGRERAA